MQFIYYIGLFSHVIDSTRTYTTRRCSFVPGVLYRIYSSIKVTVCQRVEICFCSFFTQCDVNFLVIILYYSVVQENLQIPRIVVLHVTHAVFIYTHVLATYVLICLHTNIRNISMKPYIYIELYIHKYTRYLFRIVQNISLNINISMLEIRLYFLPVSAWRSDLARATNTKLKFLTRFTDKYTN